jgi:hypothetical protein
MNKNSLLKTKATTLKTKKSSNDKDNRVSEKRSRK